MCDTLVAPGNATADGSVILAKNSDREPNDAHVLVHIPRTRHEPGSRVKCTCIEIPQVPETYEVLLANTPVRHRPSLLFSMAWSGFYREAHLA